MKSLVLLFIFSLTLLTLPAQAQSQFRYEGYIENGGTPVTAAAQTFTVTLKKPGCLNNLGLTPWSSGATITITNGEFNLVPQFSEALLSAAMDPNQLFGCTAGSTRNLEITWVDQTRTFTVALQDAPRSSFSNLAGNSNALGSRTGDQFLKIDSYAGQTPIPNAGVNTLLGLIAGTSTLYLKTSDPVNDTTKLPLAGGTMTGPINMGLQNITNATSVTATSIAGRNFYHYNLANTQSANIKAPDALGVNYTLTLPVAAPTNGSVLSTDGSGNLSWIAAATGSVTSVTGTAPIVSSGGTTPVISLDTGLGANKVPQVGGTALGANGVVVANGLGTALASLNCTLGQVIKFDASGFAVCGADIGGGITSLGGLTAASQTFASGTSGTAPAFVSSTSTHTLNIPLASGAGVTSGTISKTDYDNFNNKLGASSTFAGDISGTASTISVDKIKGTPATITALTTGNILAYNGTAWVNRNLASTDIPNLDASKVTSGLLPITLGGTGAATATAAFNNLAPTQATNSGKFLTTNGTTTSWDVVPMTPALSSLTAATANNTIENLNFAQSWNWSTLTTGSALRLSSSNNALNSANGLFNVTNSGTSTNGVLARFNSNTTAGSGMTILADGNVGIGTANPSTRLQIVDPVATVGFNKIFTAYNPTLPNNAYSQLAWGRSNTTYNQAEFNFFFDSLGSTQNALQFGLYDQPSILVLQGTGNVGIGTTSPTAKLHVAGNVKLGTNGSVFSASGVCTTGSIAYAANSPQNFNACTGVPNNTQVAVNCSPNVPLAGYITARATGTSSQIAITVGAAGTYIMTCLWMAP